MNSSPIHKNNGSLPIVDQHLLADIHHKQDSWFAACNDYQKIHVLTEQLSLLQGLLQDVEVRTSQKGCLAQTNQPAIRDTDLLSLQIMADEAGKTRRKEDKKFMQKHHEHTSPAVLASAPIPPPQAGGITDGMPFQAAFAYILLDKYVPSQEEALFALGKELNLSGYAQNLFSPLLETIKSFNSAPIVYNLGSYISQTSGTANFKYGYNLIIERYEEERSQLRKDIRNAEQAKAVLANISTNVNGNASLTPEQKKELLDLVASYTTHLTVITEQLKNLMTNLNSLVFMPGGSVYDPSYVVMGSDFSVVNLQNLEGLVVDGEIDVVKGTSSGGLLNFFNKCVADVQNFGDLAQTSQLMLELQLRAMQQQWSMVSASLKLLHNTYRTLANGYNG